MIHNLMAAKDPNLKIIKQLFSQITLFSFFEQGVYCLCSSVMSANSIWVRLGHVRIPSQLVMKICKHGTDSNGNRKHRKVPPIVISDTSVKNITSTIIVVQAKSNFCCKNRVFHTQF